MCFAPLYLGISIQETVKVTKNNKFTYYPPQKNSLVFHQALDLLIYQKNLDLNYFCAKIQPV